MVLHGFSVRDGQASVPYIWSKAKHEAMPVLAGEPDNIPAELRYIWATAQSDAVKVLLTLNGRVSTHVFFFFAWLNHRPKEFGPLYYVSEWCEVGYIVLHTMSHLVG